MKKKLLKDIRDKKNRKKFILGFAAFLIIFLIGLVKKNFQNDTFYTIKIGELIFENGIDMMDHFSFHQGMAYTYPHWLYDAVIYLFYKIGGYAAIYLSTIILFAILIMLVFKTNVKYSKYASVAAYATLICTISIGGFAAARAQLVSFILFTLEVYCIEGFLQDGKKKYLGGLLLISLILCNVHVAVWPFYYIVFFPTLVEYVVAKIINKIKLKKENKLIKFLKKRLIIEDNNRVKWLFLVMILSTVTGLFTPIGDTPYTYLVKTMMGNSQEYILEHQMMTWLNSPFTIIIAFEMIFLSFVSKVKLRDLFMTCGLILMSIISIRHLSLLALIGTICFSRTFCYYFENFKLEVDDVVIPFLTKKSVAIISFTCVILFAVITTSLQLNKEFIEHDKYPTEAVKYIKENLDIENLRIYNDYDFGSYLILEEIPVFIDSRADLYTKQFSGFEYDVFDDYYYMDTFYQMKFDEYKITHALVYKEKNKMYNLLVKDDDYKILYSDKYFALFEKKGTLDSK